MRSLLLLAALTAIPVVAGAQNTRSDQENISQSVPVSMLPPAGKCRIWMIGVAPAQQPAPTDCQTALRQRPTNGVVIFGPVEREQGASAFGGRPRLERGPEDRSSGTRTRPNSRQPASEIEREPARAPASAPARADTRAPSPAPPPASPTRPPSGTPRPTQEPVKKPPAERTS